MRQNLRTASLAALIVSLLIASQAAVGKEVAFGPREDPEGIEGYLERAFQQVRPDQLPTGILLERSAPLAGDLILAYDGSGEALPPLDRETFSTVYGDLRRAAGDRLLESLADLHRKARGWREQVRATPLGLVLVDYQTLSSAPGVSWSDGVLQVPSGELGETRRFVAVHVLADTVFQWSPDFVVPADLLVLNGLDVTQLEDLRVQIGTAPEVAVELDRPFRPAWLPDRGGDLEVAVRATVAGRSISTRGTVRYFAPREIPTNPLAPPPTAHGVPTQTPVRCAAGSWPAEDESGVRNVPFWDLDDPVVGPPYFAPWDEAFQGTSGMFSVRIVPARSESVALTLDGRCVVSLINPLVILDGLDVLNTRTNDSHLAAFGGLFKKLLEMGFDLVMVDYFNGRDWIQRNGRAFRHLMTHELEKWVDPGVLERDGVAVLGRSMGTQVIRWGLLEAESMDLDHNASLFLSIDGPYWGANIPIGFQVLAVDQGSSNEAAEMALQSLESPAPSQLLVRTFPRGADLEADGWYRQRPEFNAYRAQVAALGGMPQRTRNVATAQGSGPGTPVMPFDIGLRLMRAFGVGGSGPLIDARFTMDVYADSPLFGKVYRFERCLRVVWAPELCDEVEKTVGGLGLDTIAGSVFPTLDLLVAGLGPTVEAEGIEFSVHYSSDLPAHSHITPASAFGDVVWDNRTWEKCNTRHAFSTPTVDSLILSEMVALRAGYEPPAAPLFQTGCGLPEPSENCFPGVLWFADPEMPEFLRPWDNGAACYVTPVPAGEQGRVVAGHFVVAPELECFDGADPMGALCLFTSVQAPGVDQVTIPSTGILHLDIIDHAGPEACPARTRFVELIDGGPGPLPLDKVVCEIIPRPGVSLAELSLVGQSVMAPADSCCSVGSVRTLDGEPTCYLGTSPQGTRPFEHNGAFFYDGWD
ncbi:MAG: hypothetical protein AAF604_12805 [Acidobacteriota bacterium]